MVLEVDGKAMPTHNFDHAAATTSHSEEGLFCQMLTYEKQAFSDVLSGKATAGEYAAVGLPLVAIGLATDGMGLTSLVRNGSIVEANGLAVQTVNRIGLGSLGAVSATGILGSRQYLVNHQFPFLKDTSSE
jgi:hypothetical protein